ncbi:MAG: hypothetical protein QM500_07880 [Methylococcales bacterium]
MKHVFLLLFITTISTVTHAKSSLAYFQKMDFEQQGVLKKIGVASAEDSVSSIRNNEANNLELWKLLDTNKDDLISKTEIAMAKDVFESWDVLDSNKDGWIDFFEFSRVSVKFL